MRRKQQPTLLYLHKQKHLNIIAWLLKMKKRSSQNRNNKNITECVEYALKHYTENQEYLIIAKVCIEDMDAIPEALTQMISVADNTCLKDYKKTHRSNSLLLEILNNSIILVDDVSQERFLDLEKQTQRRNKKYYDPFENEQYISSTNTASTVSKPEQQDKEGKKEEKKKISPSVPRTDSLQKSIIQMQNSTDNANAETSTKRKPTPAATEFEKLSLFTSNGW